MTVPSSLEVEWWVFSNVEGTTSRINELIVLNLSYWSSKAHAVAGDECMTSGMNLGWFADTGFPVENSWGPI